MEEKKTEQEKKRIGFGDFFDAFTPGGLAEPGARLMDEIDRLVDLLAAKLGIALGFLARIVGKITDSFDVRTEGGISSVMAELIRIIDRHVAHFEDVISFLWGLCAKQAEKLVISTWKARKKVLLHAVGVIIVGFIFIGAYNGVTGYEYSYNGKALGEVNSQEDVVAVLDVAQESLTNEYGLDVAMDPREDFSYRRVVTAGKTLDGPDEVLEKLSYMRDTKVSAWGIFADGELVGVVNTKENAKLVLANVRSHFLEDEGRDEDDYQSISWGEKISIRNIDTTLDTVRSVNTLTSYIIRGKVKEGDKKRTPLLTVKTVEVVEYYTYQDYKVVYKKTSSMYQGDSKVTQEGKRGKTWNKARITRVNGEKVKTQILDTKVKSTPVTKIVYKGSKKRPPTIGSGNLINPCPQGRQTSGIGYRWGAFHQGVDLACATGTPIVAADGGTVVDAGWFSTYGLQVLIDHQNGMQTRYAHMSSMAVSAGDKVYQGQVIGYVGATGNAMGSHLHFEVILHGSFVNPRNYF